VARRLASAGRATANPERGCVPLSITARCLETARARNIVRRVGAAKLSRPTCSGEQGSIEGRCLGRYLLASFHESAGVAVLARDVWCAAR